MKNLKMKSIFVVCCLFTVLIFSSNKQQEFDFAKAWQSGYVDGWCYDSYPSCIDPIPPIAPLPRIQDTSYSIAYNRGFLKGYKDKRNE